MDKHLKESARLIVVCSPNARKSKFVNDEIKRFAAARSAKDIVPVLVAGFPNNEAPAEQPEIMAFPEALCEAIVPMPLPSDFRNFDLRKHKVNGSPYLEAWYKTLADIYGNDITRGQIEDRDRKHKIRRLQITLATVTAIFLVLVAALIWAILSRQEAIRQRQVAEVRGHVAQARQLAAVVLNILDARPDLALLLSVEACRITNIFEARNSLLTALQQRPRIRSFLNGYTQSAQSGTYVSDNDRITTVRFNHEGTQVAASKWNNKMFFWDARTGRPTGRPIERESGWYHFVISPDFSKLAARGPVGLVLVETVTGRSAILSTNDPGDSAILTFSDNGRLLATGSDDGVVTLWDVASRQPYCPPLTQSNRKVEGDFALVRSVLLLEFSPDGKTLAANANDADEVELWDLTTLQRRPFKGGRTQRFKWCVSTGTAK